MRKKQHLKCKIIIPLAVIEELHVTGKHCWIFYSHYGFVGEHVMCEWSINNIWNRSYNTTAKTVLWAILNYIMAWWYIVDFTVWILDKLLLRFLCCFTEHHFMGTFLVFEVRLPYHNYPYLSNGWLKISFLKNNKGIEIAISHKHHVFQLIQAVLNINYVIPCIWIIKV